MARKVIMLTAIPAWLTLAIITGIASTINGISFKLAEDNINGLVFVFIECTIAAILALIFIFFSGNESLANYIPNTKGLFWAIVAGTALIAIEGCFFLVLQKGGEISTCWPLISAIDITLTLVLGIILFSDSFSANKLMGITLAIGAIYFLSK